MHACADDWARDYQRQRVYNWERENMPPGRFLKFEEIAPYVATVWRELGREHPPLIEALPKQVRNIGGDANRFKLRFPERGATQATVLHEMAHALTSDIHGGTDAHGPAFVGEFMRIAAPRLNVPLFYLWATAKASKVDFEMRL